MVTETTVADRIPFVDLAAQHRSLAAELQATAAAVINRSQYILGPEGDSFESEFAGYCGVRHCVAVNSGTDALRLALLAAGVGPGDEVVTVSHTFIATAVAIWSTGATAVFVDIDSRTACIDLDHVIAALTPATRAIIPVHLYGRCVDIGPLHDLARDRDLFLIEDASQAHGATTERGRAGSLGDMGCFSFYPSKNLGALGDGGAVTTHDPDLAERLRALRNYGQTQRYVHTTLGFNSRLDELQAAVLRVKLPHLDSWNAKRHQRASQYARRLSHSGLTLPELLGLGEHVYHLYVVRSNRRDDLMSHLRERAIDTQVHYPIPIHQQRVCNSQPSVTAGALPNTERYASEALSLPMYPELTPEQVDAVCDVILEFET